MPAHGTPPWKRAHDALAKLETQGGESRLPEVLKSSDVIPFMGRGWFSDALRLDNVPGMRARPGGVWLCEDGAFVEWLQRLSEQHGDQIDTESGDEKRGDEHAHTTS
jgi:hypothetical protein